MFFEKINTFKYFGQTGNLFQLVSAVWYKNRILISQIRNLPETTCFLTLSSGYFPKYGRANFSYLISLTKKVLFYVQCIQIYLGFGLRSNHRAARIWGVPGRGFASKFTSKYKGIDVNKENNSNFSAPQKPEISPQASSLFQRK